MLQLDSTANKDRPAGHEGLMSKRPRQSKKLRPVPPPPHLDVSTATVSQFAYFAGVMKTRNVVVDMVIIRYEGKGIIEPVDWHYHASKLISSDTFEINK